MNTKDLSKSKIKKVIIKPYSKPKDTKHKGKFLHTRIDFTIRGDFIVVSK